MKVLIAPEARAELTEIWNWNAKERGPRHADNYLALLEKHIEALKETFAKGKPVGNRPELHYILIRRRNRGNGHLAVYTVEAKLVTVVHVFHTAQDWQAKL